MDKQPEPLRERLLAQFEPDRDKLANHRREVQAMLEKNEQTLRFQTRQTRSMVIGTCFALLGTGFMTLAYLLWGEPPAVWLGFVVCFALICASVELVKYYIIRTRVEVLKD